MTVSATSDSTGDGRLSHRQILTILSGLLLGMFLGALDQTIVASAMRVIADDLHGQTAQAWITTAYLITATLATPLYGKLSDIYGRKRLYLIAISVFIVGSVLCGMATSIYELAGYRALQGLGGGGLMSLALTIISDITSPRERSRYQGYFMGVFGTASVLGPVIGGFFAGTTDLFGVVGWRWVFLVNVPIAIAALIVVSRVLNVPSARVDHRVDYWGAAALVVALVPLLTVAEQGRDWGWDSGISMTMFGIGAIGLGLFVLVERAMGDEALIPLRMFRRHGFALGNSMNFIVGMGMFGGMASLPLYLQIVRGMTPTEAGLMLIPMTVGIIASTGLSGKLISKTGRVKVFPVIGTAVLGTGLFLLSSISADTSLVVVGACTMVLGAGLGLCMQTLTLVVQNDAAPKDMGVATASTNLFRQLGGTVGTGAFLSVLFTVLPERIGAAFRVATHDPAFRAAATDPAVLADPVNRGLLQGMSGGAPSGQSLDDTTFLSQLDPRLARPFLDGFASSMDTVFFVGGCVVMGAFVLSWFLRNVVLSDKSTLQRRAEEERAASA